MNTGMIRGWGGNDGDTSVQIRVVKTMDRGLAYGESCFETFRVIDGAIFDWAGHWQRLLAGLAEFAVLLPEHSEAEMRSACLAEAAKLATDCLVRLTLSGGLAEWGLLNRSDSPRIQIQCKPYQTNLSPVSLRLQDWPFPIKKKTAKFSADYAETLRVLHGADDAHVLFEQGGNLLATATANVLIYRHGDWFTPPADAGVLPGRVRACLVRKDLLIETACPLHWLDDCEAMLVSNSAVFLQPVVDIDRVQRSVPMAVQHAAIELLLDALRGEEGVRL